jgi:hypothetical protein
MRKRTSEDFPDVSPSQDLTERYPEDQFLRKHNFRIHARPGHGPAVWSREGHLYTFAEALGVANREVREQGERDANPY